MDRKEIKSLAKQKIKGNLWNLLWPMLVISLISYFLTKLIGDPYSGIDFTNANNFEEMVALIRDVKISPTYELLSSIISLVVGIASVSYVKYVLNFVRTGNAEFKDIIDTIKSRWLQIILAELLMSVIIIAFTLLLVVPGIIRAFAYAMVTYIVVDTDLDAKDALKKSRTMMKGYKWDYFVFNLSFIGWYILLPFTLFILAIWLVPYIMVSQTIYYDKLKEING